MINALVARLALARGDESLLRVVRESYLAGGLLAALSGLRARLSQDPRARKVGEALSSLAFLIIAGLFFIIGAPQFAADKEGLAIISLAAATLYIVGKMLGSRGDYRPTWMDAAVAGYLAANIIATFASHYMPQAVKGLSKAVVYVVFYFTVQGLIQDRPKRLIWLIAAALGSALYVTLYGLYQYKIGVAPLATWEDPTVESKGTRIYSTLGNPNLLAGYLLPLAPLAAALGVYLWQSRNALCKWLLAPGSLVLAALVTIAIFLTGSRGGFLSVGITTAFAVLALVTYLLVRNKKLIVPAIAGVVLLSIAGYLLLHFLMPTLEQRIVSIFAGSEHSSNAYRMYVWRASLEMFKDNWWLGVGPGNTAFRLAYGLYMKSGFDALGTYCVPLEVGVETGILGLLSFCALIFFAMCRAHLLFYMGRGAILAIGLAAALVALMVQGLVDTVFYRPQVHFLFWLVVAAISAYSLELAKPDETVSKD